MQTIIAAIFFLWNIFSFGLYAYDKMAAKSGWWRVPEKSLLTVSVLGGCFGGTLAMYLLRHKTQHTRFILVNWIADAGYLVMQRTRRPSPRYHLAPRPGTSRSLS